MALPLEDYALIGDTQSCALVGKDGSIDWLCWPRFDSDACFTALLGTADNGRWKLAPREVRGVRRRYRPETLVLETEFEAAGGRVLVTDCMPPRDLEPNIVREVRCLEGTVALRSCLRLRFGYGNRTPWIRKERLGFTATAGPDATTLRASVPVALNDFDLVSDFTLKAGESAWFNLAWHPSNEVGGMEIDPRREILRTHHYWSDWSARCIYEGPWREAVLRSLLTIKAMTFSPTGGLVAAATTSLPEQPGGVRNWDYRICWLRDATLALQSLMDCGYLDEAREWRDWLLRAIAGEPDELQIMYGLSGERRLTEEVLEWLPGYLNSRPVRIGNSAHKQFQLDVYGEVIGCLTSAVEGGLRGNAEAWDLQRNLGNYVCDHWRDPDEGIWEVRGGRQQFTYSKVMAWVALDRLIHSVKRHRVTGPLERWCRVREEIRHAVFQEGFDRAQNAFVQVLGSNTLDASLLRLPITGFLPASDPRFRGTVEAIERRLVEDGYVYRYDSHRTADGLPSGEGVFLACSFWLADAYQLLGRKDDAEALFERLLSLRNDVGLLSEEYSPSLGRLVGNYPQAFSHIALIHSARMLSGDVMLTRAEHTEAVQL